MTSKLLCMAYRLASRGASLSAFFYAHYVNRLNTRFLWLALSMLFLFFVLVSVVGFFTSFL